jgi:Holliday junction resolvase
MASQDIGKKFEERFKKDYIQCFPDTLIYRLPDQQSGYAGGGSANPCDFMCYPGNCVLMVECKAHAKASIPFSAIPQYERLLDYKGKYKTFPGVVVWFYEKDTVIWVSIEEMEKMVNDGEKSIGLRMIDNKKPYKKSYNIITIPSTKLRTFMESDYKYLVEVLNG